ncbi:hypothetical protein WG66_005883 [Moniliophthora roreri]|nr:hypothetical protein WG66_005883 [Moniliophthora roreri]
MMNLSDYPESSSKFARIVSQKPILLVATQTNPFSSNFDAKLAISSGSWGQEVGDVAGKRGDGGG